MPAVIPYFQQPSLSIGPFTLHGFGVLVALAVFLGMKLLHKRAAEVGLEERNVARFIGWVLLGALAGAHLIDRFVYFPAQTLRDPMSIVRVWEGLSSFGGFVGGTLSGIVFFRRHANPGTLWKLTDCFAYAFSFAWILGRMGCFVAFDHPGRETTFFLSETYKDGVVRHNLGLDEALYTVLIAALFWVLGRKPRFPGFFVGLFILVYAPFRFIVDFLRIVDVRYFHLTPGQYGCIAFMIGGALILWTQRHNPPHVVKA